MITIIMLHGLTVHVWTASTPPRPIIITLDTELHASQYNTRANKIRGQNQFEELRLCVLAVHLGMNLFEQQDHYI